MMELQPVTAVRVRLRVNLQAQRVVTAGALSYFLTKKNYEFILQSKSNKGAV